MLFEVRNIVNGLEKSDLPHLGKFFQRHQTFAPLLAKDILYIEAYRINIIPPGTLFCILCDDLVLYNDNIYDLCYMHTTFDHKATYTLYMAPLRTISRAAAYEKFAASIV